MEVDSQKRSDYLPRPPRPITASYYMPVPPSQRGGQKHWGIIPALITAVSGRTIRIQQHPMPSCYFCDIPKDRIMPANEYVFTIRDGYPVTDL